jgi:hypothetical protein
MNNTHTYPPSYLPLRLPSLTPPPPVLPGAFVVDNDKECELDPWADNPAQHRASVRLQGPVYESNPS